VSIKGVIEMSVLSQDIVRDSSAVRRPFSLLKPWDVKKKAIILNFIHNIFNLHDAELVIKI
jgi:hypothetical protein